MLAVGRALMTNPRLLILDEATEGLAPVIPRRDLALPLGLLKQQGRGDSHRRQENLNVLKRLANRHFVIEKGRTVWTGDSADLERDAETVHRYVGI